MADGDRRRVTLERVEEGVYRATNPKGAQLTFGSKAADGFTPVELLLAAIGGCSAVDVDVITGRHAEHERFEVAVEAEKTEDDGGGNILRDVRMTFHVTFPEGPDGDKARERLPRAVRVSHDRSCTVSRTVEAGTPVTVDIAE
ncbi:MAG: OsmC family protein [Nitriliruptor sp.]